MRSKKLMTASVAVGLGILGAGTAVQAGPFIISGTDADDHGFASGGANQDGWFFMQRALENIAPGVGNGNKKVVTLGSSAGQALNAANSAFGLSSLPGLGWTIVNIDGDAAIQSFLDGTALFNINNAGILMMDSDSNVGGGATASEVAKFTSNASAINTWMGAGGGLFSQANGYGFLSTLVPGLTAVSEFDSGITLTAAGTAAFPGLTNPDLSAGPFHNRFENVGSIPVLGVDAHGHAIILGASGGSITAPTIPDGGSFLPVFLGLAGLGFAFRRKVNS